PIILKGKLDRIDEVDGKLRIIDYKTGNVTSSQVEIVDWSEITSEYDYIKAFQLLFYALMYNSKEPISSFEAGIFSFKNLNSGLLRFATKDKKGSRKKDTTITAETLTSFTSELKKMILEICNPQIPFQEKEL
ncbi:MAG: PD-(D/E)XK nuclease family protein, partial [Pricia sp.]|nr:PD-(D/E)XK nuclease family protein [Pricia sp.]